jgi:hypothetical protein
MSSRELNVAEGKTTKGQIKPRRTRLKWSTIYLSAGKHRFDELDAEVQQLAAKSTATMDEVVPLVVEIESILRKQISVYEAEAKEVGFPTWAEWVAPIAELLCCSPQMLEECMRKHHETLKPGLSSVVRSER